MKDNLVVIVKFLVFIVCIAMIVIGVRSIGRLDLGIMLLGLAGLMGLLYDYNRKFI